MKKSLIVLFLLLSMALTVSAAADDDFICATDTYGNAPSVSLFSSSTSPDSYKGLEEAIIKSWKNLDSQINISKYNIPKSDIPSVYFNICHRNPEYYYVERTLSYNSSTIVFSYSETDKTKISAQMKAIDDATNEILMYIDDDMTDFQKVMTVHDYMVLNYQYDQSLNNHSITIMTTGTGVCESYVFAFNHVMKQLGIDAVYVGSDEMMHAWSLVKLDGEWYHIDLTWDDPTKDKYAQVRHTYALLSTEKIMSMPNPHTGFSLDGLVASSTKYDSSSWHDAICSMTTVNGKHYWVSNNSVLCSDGSTIYTGLSSLGNNWKLSATSYVPNVEPMAGIAHNGNKIYFNTDAAIMCYDTETSKITTVKDIIGVCGLFIKNNVLYYCAYNFGCTSSEISPYSYAGEIKLSDFSIFTPHIENNKINVRVFNDSEEGMRILFSDNGFITEKIITKKGLNTIEFDNNEETEIFYWTKDFKPIAPKHVIEH